MRVVSGEFELGVESWVGRKGGMHFKKAIYPVDDNDKKETKTHVLLNTFSGGYLKNPTWFLTSY